MERAAVLAKLLVGVFEMSEDLAAGLLEELLAADKREIAEAVWLASKAIADGVPPSASEQPPERPLLQYALNAFARTMEGNPASISRPQPSDIDDFYRVIERSLVEYEYIVEDGNA